MIPDKMQRYRLMFLEECREHVATLERTLNAMREDGFRQPLIDDAFRAIHSIKGGAGMFGMERIVPYAHVFETVLDGIRLGETPASAAVIEAALRATDALSDLVEASGAGTDLDPDYEKPYIEALEQAAAVPTSVSPQRLERFTIVFKPKPEFLEGAGDPLLIAQELKKLGHLKTQADLSDLPSLEALAPSRSYLGWTFELSTEQGEASVREVFQLIGDSCVFSIARHSTGTKLDAASSIRVDLARVDRLVNLAGEIAISQALVAQQIAQSSMHDNPKLYQELSQLLSHTRDLQDSVMAIRAQPISAIFDRMPRLVRELSEQTGKKLRLEVTGGDTEIDMTVIENLSDPIMHMIRNAADHGIERASIREARGKEEGVITLNASQRGSRIVIEIGDDGGGLDRQKIRDTAVRKKLISRDDALSVEEIDNLLFIPGFSTASSITSISGRGVGMDVVKRNIEKLGGRVHLRSEPGTGSTVVLTLPLTLAVLEGMIIRSGPETYVLPVSGITECRSPWAGDAGLVPGSGPVLNVRGRYINLVQLHEVFGHACDPVRQNSVAVIADTEASGHVALIVDEVLGQAQVVVKSMSQHVDPVPGVAGATILSDGRVALILDATDIMRLAARTPFIGKDVA